MRKQKKIIVLKKITHKYPRSCFTQNPSKEILESLIPRFLESSNSMLQFAVLKDPSLSMSDVC